jgi:hypothetical protein
LSRPSPTDKWLEYKSSVCDEVQQDYILHHLLDAGAQVKSAEHVA